MNKIKPVWFYSLYRNYFFLSKTQWSLACAEFVLLISKLHGVKIERSMSCKEPFDKQCSLVQYRKKWSHIILIFIKA